MDDSKRIIMTEHDRTALAFARRVLMSSDHAQDVQTMQAILCLDSLAHQYDTAEAGRTIRIMQSSTGKYYRMDQWSKEPSARPMTDVLIITLEAL